MPSLVLSIWNRIDNVQSPRKNKKERNYKPRLDQGTVGFLVDNTLKPAQFHNLWAKGALKILREIMLTLGIYRGSGNCNLSICS